MQPAKQRFNANRLSGLEAQLRLKMEPECVALKRLAELSQQHEVVRTVGFHMLRINQMIVARFSRGPPRHIRVTEKSVRVIALFGDHGDSHAGADSDGQAAEPERGTEALESFCSQVMNRFCG